MILGHVLAEALKAIGRQDILKRIILHEQKISGEYEFESESGKGNLQMRERQYPEVKVHNVYSMGFKIKGQEWASKNEKLSTKTLEKEVGMMAI